MSVRVLAALLADAAIMVLLTPGPTGTGMPADYPLDLLEVWPDPMKERTYSLHLGTEHFRFAPEAVSRAAVFGEGHAHLYVEDVLLGRIYGSWHHLPRLKPGKHEILVTLNWNNHDEYSIGGKTIAAGQILEVK